ncbi:MAG TPA: hypothetical protein VFM71_08255 [Gemmatimonadaceae bacterium]|nr:hypothetical protein [Gemmatimonadaceae bacterium]
MRAAFRHLAGLLACVTLAAAACSDDNDAIGVMEPPAAIVTAASVVAGEVVPVRLENRSARTWSYSMCGKALLQRRDGDQWTTLPPPLILCADMLLELPPGDVVDEEMFVPPATEPGTHRILVLFELEGEEFDRVTNSFEVTAPPEP